MNARKPRLALISCAALLLVVGVAACGGDDDDGSSGVTGAPGTPTPFDHDPGPAPLLEMPVSRYSIAQPDLGTGYITDVEYTFELDAESYGSSRAFSTASEGARRLQDWGYLGGYETSYTPEGRNQAVLAGAYTIKVESHLFADEAGAKEAYAYFRERLSQSVSEPVTADPVGNESSGWRYIDRENGVRGTSVAAEFHQYLFRRGNLVAIVLTWGAEPFMEIRPAYELAHLLDQKALGNASLIEPTPVSNTVASGN